jgi:succinate dehydrogenase / fumarate reductase membrane anchor subunit
MTGKAQPDPPEQPALRSSWGYDAIAWRWMRYSAFLLIPLAFGHILLQDILVGVHTIDLDYVAVRWANLGWRIYDVFLLVFAFAHGMNGLRQVIGDYLYSSRARQVASWLLLAIWLVISAAGSIALVGGVR